MKFKLPLIAACAAALALAACGGGSDAPQREAPANPATLTKIDVALGSGAEATIGKAVIVHYTGWLYSTTAAGNKGAQFDTSIGPNRAPLELLIGANKVLAGVELGIQGMKVGGKRTVLIPSTLAYGTVSAGNGAIQPNSGLVFDIELLTVK